MQLFEKINKNIAYYADRTIKIGRGIRFRFKPVDLCKPVFVVGCSRSGTTAVYKTYSHSRYLASMNKESHTMWEALHPAIEKNWDNHDLAESDVRVGDLKNVSGYFYHYLGSGRMVDKANQNCFRIPYILSLFPDAVFVWVKRNGPDNINSLIHGWARPDEYAIWSGNLPETIAIDNGTYSRWCPFLLKKKRKLKSAAIEEGCSAQWIAANHAVLEAKSKVPKAQWVEIAYEDILKDTVKTFQTAFQKAGVPFDQDMADFCASLVKKPYNAFSKPMLDKWKEENPERIKRILPQIKDMMEKLGYDF